MCLNELEKFEPAKKGWQVKCHGLGLKYTYYNLFFGEQLYELNKEYEADEIRIDVKPAHGLSSRDWKVSGTYLTGFHVFHKLSDAERYLQSRGGRAAMACIVEVECLGTKTTGWQDFEYLDPTSKHLRWHRAKVTVCSKIKITKEISYGISNQDAVL